MPRPQRKGRAKREITYADLKLLDRMAAITGVLHHRGEIAHEVFKTQAELDQFRIDNAAELAPLIAAHEKSQAEADAAYQAWLATQPKYVPTGKWD